MPRARKPDQAAPAAKGPAGASAGDDDRRNVWRAQQGDALTTAFGVRAARHRPLAQGRRPRADACSRTSTSARRSPTSTTSASPSGSCTRAGPEHTACSGRTAAAAKITRAGFLQAGQGDAGLRPVLDRARVARVGGHGSRRTRLRDEVLHRRGHVRPGRQQHAGVLHPGRDQVPRHHPRRQAAPGPRDPAGADRARHVLGLRVAAHRGHPPRDVGDVRPRHPALVPDDGGLRRPHVPARQRRRRDRAGEVPLEAGGR